MSGPHDPREQMFVQTRPWGQFEQFVSNERVTVKIITVLPGHRLSLQSHENRGEFWHILDVPIDIQVGVQNTSNDRLSYDTKSANVQVEALGLTEDSVCPKRAPS